MIMPHLLINTTFSVSDSVLSDFMHWIKELYIPKIEHTKGCSLPLLLRVAASSDDNNQDETYALQLRTDSPATAMSWLEREHRELLREFFKCHTPEQLPMFTTVMEIVG